MKNSRLLGVILGFAALAGSVPCSFAGSERWIMSMTPERMVQENLVHVRFIGADGAALESDAMKQMLVREQDCDSGRTYKMVKDYKMGYSPENRLVGIFLFHHAWQNKALCFSVPGVGKVVKNLTDVDKEGRYIQLQVMP